MWNRLIFKFILNTYIITTYFLTYINVSLQILLLYISVHKIYIINVSNILLQEPWNRFLLFTRISRKFIIVMSSFYEYIADIFSDLLEKQDSLR